MNRRFTAVTKSGLKFYVRNFDDIGLINHVVLGKDSYSENEIKDNSTVIDIGAHIGVFTVISAKSADNVRILSFEPFSENFQILKKNIELNGIRATVFEKAVCRSSGTRVLYLNESDQSHSLHRKNNASLSVECTSLKDIFNENEIKKCALLKIDAEGAEYEILYNTPKEVFKKIEEIFLEYHHDNIEFSESKNNPDALKKFLKANGFEVEKLMLSKDIGYLRARKIKH
jgi:FkbM family methyltransferase